MAGRKGKRGTSLPKDETKEQRFIRVCSARVQKATKAISNIAHCASSNYGYTEQQVSDISRALRSSVDSTIESFNPKKVDPSGFRFTETE